jgi:hypothetical protein
MGLRLGRIGRKVKQKTLREWFAKDEKKALGVAEKSLLYSSLGFGCHHKRTDAPC